MKITAFKAAEDGNGFICHLYNLSNEAGSVTLKPDKKLISAEFSDILERKTEEIPVDENGASFQIPAKAVRTVRICVE